MTAEVRRGLREALAAVQDLVRQRRLPEAISVCDRMLAVAPDDVSVLLHKGVVLLLGDDSARAERHFEALTRAHPDLEDAWQGLGKALYDQQRCEAAVAAFSRAAELSRMPARALYHRGLAHLLAGDFAAGWRDYEHRLTVPDFRHRVFDRPRWDGSPLAGRRLLVIAEQGYGDVFQFARFLPRLRTLDGTVIFECPSDLRAVLAPVLDGLTIVPPRGREAPEVAFDCYVSLLSLPLMLGLGPDDLASDGPYLAGAAAPRTGTALRVGVCWAGKPSHPQDLHRSMDPEFLAPLAGVPGVTLVALQKETGHRPPLPGLCGFLGAPDRRLDDFAATAREIAGLDLVITVDTSVAHLAAALGRPVWLLLSRACDWRWMTRRDDSPWYPTMRLFRQERLGDWPPVIAAAREALAALSRTVAVGAPRPRLDDVTLVCIDTMHHDAALHAIRRSRAVCDFGAVLFLTDRAVVEDGVSVYRIAPIAGLEDYSRIVLREIAPLIQTSHALIIQWDGYVVDPAMWDPAFLSFDYIGAVWSFHTDGHRVGNGGFSLRSRRLMQALLDPAFPVRHPEDDAICRTYRPALEQLGMRFADEATAMRFSTEVVETPHPSFGFHGLFNLWRFVPARELDALLDRVDPRALTSIPTFTLLANYAVLRRWREAASLLRRMPLPPLDVARGLAGVMRTDVGRAETLIATIAREGATSAEDLVRAGKRHHAAGRLDAARECYDRALALDPRAAEALHMRGVARMMQGQGPEGVADVRAALREQPDLPSAWRNLAHHYLQTLLRDDTPAEAERLALWAEADDATARAVAAAPADAACHYQRAAVLLRLGRHAEAIAAAEAAIRLDPTHGQARMTLALARLVTGDLPAGFAAYEARWTLASMRKHAGFDPATAWRGEPDPNGLTVLVRAEQGHGDTIHMARYVPMLLDRGARVTVLAHAGLRRLLAETWSDRIMVLTENEALPDHDLHCSMLSLPLIFGTMLHTIPATVPYLHADPARVAAWRERLPAGRAIGLAWTGDPSASMNHRRSVPVEKLLPLGQIAGVTLVSLQKGVPAPMLDWTAELEDFADTAALVAALDLVITVDTSVAHLAGALGRPVWLLNRFDTDWRWLLERDDSPWYPTLRQFRQTTDGDWDDVIARVRDSLAAWTTTPRDHAI